MKTKKKTWDRGRKRLDGEVVQLAIKVSRDQYAYLKSTGNLSAEVRRLVDVARTER